MLVLDELLRVGMVKKYLTEDNVSYENIFVTTWVSDIMFSEKP
jgi:hypothetical protein